MSSWPHPSSAQVKLADEFAPEAGSSVRASRLHIVDACRRAWRAVAEDALQADPGAVLEWANELLGALGLPRRTMETAPPLSIPILAGATCVVNVFLVEIESNPQRVAEWAVATKLVVERSDGAGGTIWAPALAELTTIQEIASAALLAH